MTQSTSLSIIKFHEDDLVAISNNNGQFVALKPISDSLGLNWKHQKESIRNDEILSEGGWYLPPPIAQNGQETFCLRVDLLNGWLFSISDKMIKKPEVREKVLQYKRECYKVLYEHFYGQRKEDVFAKVEEDGVYLNYGGMKIPLTEFNAKLRVVDNARATWGIAKARQIWVEMDLPKGGADKYLSPQLELIND